MTLGQRDPGQQQSKHEIFHRYPSSKWTEWYHTAVSAGKREGLTVAAK
jgi:hypothetical protein